jgi:single-stranded DNA-binding protein
VELKFSAAGNAWARLPLSFKNRRRDDAGNWSHDKEILIDGMVFGALAEFLADNMDGRGELAVTGELYTETFKKRDGSDGFGVKMRVLSAAPVGKVREKVAVAAAPVADEPPF